MFVRRIGEERHDARRRNAQLARHADNLEGDVNTLTERSAALSREIDVCEQKVGFGALGLPYDVEHATS